MIDCPRYNATKNGADIRIVVDAIDALAPDTRYEEFVIASGDSDMTPLVQRLRRADRRTVIVSPADAAEAYTAIADLVLDSQHLPALIQGEQVDLDDDVDDDVGKDADGAGDVGDGDRSADDTDTTPINRDEALASFRAIVVAEYNDASAPLNNATLAQRLRHELGRGITDTNWFGLGSFTRAVDSLELPNLRMSEYLLWDDSRHGTPDLTTTRPQRVALPEPVERLADHLSLPRLHQASWPAIYRTLSDYAQARRLNLTECTSWARDRLREQGIPISRSAVGFVVRGTSFGGCPLHRQPAPTSAEIRTAFINNVLSRTENAEITSTDDEIETVRTWLGEQPDNGELPAG